MTKIVLLSDTHGYLDPKILKYLSGADQIWHAGDIGSLAVTDTLKQHATLHAVYGNIDNHELRQEFPEHVVLHVEKVTILMIHIGGYPGTYNPKTKALIAQHKPDLVVVGHSHILKVMHSKSPAHLHMNPGAAGKHGFHKMKTLLRFEIQGDQIQQLEAIELGKRGF